MELICIRKVVSSGGESKWISEWCQLPHQAYFNYMGGVFTPSIVAASLSYLTLEVEREVKNDAIISSVILQLPPHASLAQ